MIHLSALVIIFYFEQSAPLKMRVRSQRMFLQHALNKTVPMFYTDEKVPERKATELLQGITFLIYFFINPDTLRK